MKTFGGFPADDAPGVLLPELLFTELLTEISDLAELKVILHVLWRLGRASGEVPFVRRADLEADRRLLAGLGEQPYETLNAALAQVTERAVLLEAVDPSSGGERILFANTPKGRAAVEALKRGRWPEELAAETRPNIFTLYEQNIGVLTPLIADELRDAEQTYPAEWIEEAIGEAAAANKRSWRYARAILERWSMQGRGDRTSDPASDGFRRRYVRGRYGEFIDH